MTYPPDWSRSLIADLSISIVDCVNKTAPSVDYETPYKMIRTTNVRDGWVDLSRVKFVERDTFETWTRRQTPKRGDIILTREAPLGEVGMLRSNDQVFLGQRTVGYRIDPEKADSQFVLYAMQFHEVQSQISAFGSGSTVEHMRVPDCGRFEITHPPLPIQRRIAGILSAYDDLIEVNTRRIKALEEMARRTYEEWFVTASSPNWPIVLAEDLIEFDPRTKVPREGEKLFVPMSALSETGMVIAGLETKAGNAGSKFKNGDTLFARITPCLENGKTGFVDILPNEQPTAFGSTEFIVMRAKEDVPPEFVYLLARSESFREIAILSMSGATGRQRVRRDSLKAVELSRPPAKTLQRFGDLMRPKFRFIRNLANQNTNLCAQRDLLLPRLVSGAIDVSDAEASLPEPAEVAAE